MTSAHLNARGEAFMVDVGAKETTRRRAVARGSVTMSPGALRALRAGSLRKGDALAVARVAGIMAAKRTAELIPLCHPVAIDAAEVRLTPGRRGVAVEAVVSTAGRTGVEMEALSAVAAACLALYDMAKSADRGMVIGPVWLAEKSGGRSGLYRRSRPPR